MRFLVTVVLAMFFSCMAYAQYMSPEAIQRQYDSMKAHKSYTQPKLDAKALARKKHLVPLNKFINKASMEGLRATYKANLRAEKSAMVLPNTVDLRFRDTPIKLQDDGKCTAYSGTALIENLLQRNGKIPGLDLSEWSAWYWYGQYSCEAFVNAMTKNYLCDESAYPQYGTRSTACKNDSWAKLNSVTFINDDTSAMQGALARDSVVYIGMQVPNSMLNCDAVINPNTTMADGGHALAIVGYLPSTDGKEVFAILKNSWGADCGDRGYQYYPMSLCKNSNGYCVMWEFASVDSKHVAPTPTPVPTVVPTIVPTPKPEPTCLEWKCNWWTLCIKKTCSKWSE